MSCSNPLIAVRYQVPDPDNLGRKKDKIKIFSRSSGDYANQFIGRYGYELLYLPCGHCDACKMAYRKDWAVRCEMESMLHEKSCFVTLTFSDKFLKPLPVKEDIQYFLHKLRDSYGIKCRYFACGELGSKTARSHYHIILFGYKPDDLKFYGLSKSGFPMFTSKFLDKVWSKGQVQVQDFDISCASYVAGYVKKDKNQCFIMESTRPGLGHDYMKNNLHKLFKYGHYQGKNGQVHRLPRYFEKICDKVGYDIIHIKSDNQVMMEEINRSRKFNLGLLHDQDLFVHDGVVLHDKLKKMKRSL